MPHSRRELILTLVFTLSHNTSITFFLHYISGELINFSVTKSSPDSVFTANRHWSTQRPLFNSSVSLLSLNLVPWTPSIDPCISCEFHWLAKLAIANGKVTTTPEGNIIVHWVCSVPCDRYRANPIPMKATYNQAIRYVDFGGSLSKPSEPDQDPFLALLNPYL